MNAKDFNRTLAKKLGVTQDQAALQLKQVTTTLSGIYARRLGMTFKNFGTFTIHKVDSRKGYSPILKKHILFPPRRVLSFRPSETLKERIKNIDIS